MAGLRPGDAAKRNVKVIALSVDPFGRALRPMPQPNK